MFLFAVPAELRAQRREQPVGELLGAAGREAAALLKEGTVRGLSFGYRVREARGDNPRELVSVELVEVSLVTFPMQPKARVHALEESVKPV